VTHIRRTIASLSHQSPSAIPLYELGALDRRRIAALGGVKAIYQRLVTAGRPKKLALITAMRKLLSIPTPCSETESHGNPLDPKDSRYPCFPGLPLSSKRGWVRVETLSLGRCDGADRLRLVETQHDALRQKKLVVNAVLRDVPGAQVLADKQRTDVRIDNRASLD
jgi:hypothetical protein